MTDIWKLPNGNYNLRRHSKFYLELTPNGLMICSRETLPADAVPMVPETGRQVTGEELFDAWENGFSAFSRQAEHEQRAWNSAAERLNLRVRETEPRQPWDVLREAADILTNKGYWPSTISAVRICADNIQAAAKEKSQRDREIEGIRLLGYELNDSQVSVIIDALDVVRGEQA